MSETFNYNNYSIVASLNEQSIYLKINDTVNFLSYEGNIDLKELRVSIDLEGVYKIIVNCFKKESNYSVTNSVNSGILKLVFNALFGGFLKINFEVLLREKLMSNDGQLTLNFNMLEQHSKHLEQQLEQHKNKTEQDIQYLMNIINKLEVHISSDSSNNIKYANISATTLTKPLF